MKSITAIIPARGGSKGLPRKNVRMLCGKPLISYSIAAAQECEWIDRCIVSTEDQEIKKISLQLGAEVIDRPDSLAADASLSRDVVRHVLMELMKRSELPEYFALLQPTSPLRTSQHLGEAIEQFLASGKNASVSIAEMEHHPFKCVQHTREDEWTPMIDYKTLEAPRQLLPTMYRPNGAIYLVSSAVFLKEQSFFVPPVHFYVMDRESSIDIDDEIDLTLADLILTKHRHACLNGNDRNEN